LPFGFTSFLYNLPDGNESENKMRDVETKGIEKGALKKCSFTCGSHLLLPKFSQRKDKTPETSPP